MKYILITIFTLFFAACSQNSLVEKRGSPQKRLETLFGGLSPLVKQKDAKKLSHGLLKQAQRLNTLYERRATPWVHNFLVNLGVKKRGLCWHFTYDMIKFANTIEQESFDFYIAGANIDEYWSEHNSLLVTCKGCKFEKGILIDPWRDTNRVYFSPLNKDKKYKWTQRGGLQNDN